MNQSILFNDDLSFNETHHAWSFTGLVNGQYFSVFIAEKYHSKEQLVSNTTKFDWEEQAEDYLENHELDSQTIWLNPLFE